MPPTNPATTTRPKRATKPRGRGSEHAEQVALMGIAAALAPRVSALALLYAVPNGARTAMSVARRLKAEGMKSGVPDLHLPVPRQGLAGLWVEMKYGRNTTSPEQEWWIEQLTREGHRVAVCYSAEAALGEILAYLGVDPEEYGL